MDLRPEFRHLYRNRWFPRQGISHKAFLEVFCLSVRQFYSLSSGIHTWSSFHVYVVDGSTIQISESRENYEVFGSNPNKTKRESPRASISVLYNVMNDIVFNDSLHSYRYNERESSLFTYPSFGNKESLNLKSVHFLLGNVNIAYLVTNLLSEQMTVANLYAFASIFAHMQ